MLSGSTLFWVNQDANAQITEQTDRSEDDWRKSKKKRGSSDIFEGITNTRKDGQGWGSGPVDPIDSLPAESRRHLMKERAKAIAMSDPGQPVTAPYKPSDDAASDPGLAAQEKEAWDDLLEDMNDSMGQGQSDQSGQNGTGDSSQQQNDQQSSGQQSSNQSGQSSSQDMAQGGGSSSSQSPNGPLRGGSSQSVSDILAQIKGLKSGGTRGSSAEMGTGSQSGDSSAQKAQSMQGESSQGQSTQVQAGQGQAKQSTATQQGTSQSSGQSSAHASTQGGQAGQSGGQGQQGQASDAGKVSSSSNTASTPEPISPLDYIKKQRDGDNSGQRSSASDFLKKKKN